MATASQQAYLGILGQMMTGYARTQVLYVAAKLGVADQLAPGPRGVDDLCRALRADPRSLHRFLRYMVAFQLATETPDGRYALAPLGEFLRSDHPDSVRKPVLYTGEVNYPAGRGMLHTLQTGEPAFDHVFGQPYFDYFGTHPEVGELFNDLMSRASQDRARAVIGAYDFSGAGLIIDVGGGNGTLLAAILRAHPHARGMVYDRAPVAPEAGAYLGAQGVAERCQAVGGSFFETVPSGADIYILSNVIHDWNDEQSACILRNCAAAMGPASRLLLIEEVMSERVADGPATVLSDMAMMLLTGGFERTRSEYEALLAGAGLRLARQVPFEPTRGPAAKPTWAVIEALPASHPAGVTEQVTAPVDSTTRPG